MADEKKWYCLKVISGKERKLKERLDKEIQNEGWTDIVTQVIVPVERKYKIRGGKKVISETPLMPGILLVEAVSSRFSGEIVKSIEGLTDIIYFLEKNNLMPLRPYEVNRLLGQIDDASDAGESLADPFVVGETVKIIDGPFNEFVGDIQEINEEKKKLKVIVKIFGRGTEVEVNFLQVEKQN